MKTVLLLSLVSVLPSVAHAELFEAGNSPVHFSKISETEILTTMSELPMKGAQLDDRYGWSETYWPSNLGGIAYRWSHPNPQPFKYKLHSKEELMVMSLEQRAQLSPSELYDIAMGDYSYTLTNNALRRYTKNDLWWEGICHGWAQAATNYPEPAWFLLDLQT